MPKTVTPRPFLKWAGGKSASAEAILAQFPASFNGYWESFLGGGAVFFALQRLESNSHVRCHGPIVLSDTNREIVDCYIGVRDALQDVIDVLRHFSTFLSRDEFHKIRASKPKGLAARAARTIYLNKTGFNGLFRVNAAGRFNVSYGRYARPNVLDEENLRACSDALQEAEIIPSDFGVVRGAHKGDVVYFDPPYLPTSKTASFTGYSSGGFDLQDHKRLRHTADSLVDRGVDVIVSQSDTPESREIWNSELYCCSRIEVRRTINSEPTKRGKVGELLLMSGTGC